LKNNDAAAAVLRKLASAALRAGPWSVEAPAGPASATRCDPGSEEAGTRSLSYSSVNLDGLAVLCRLYDPVNHTLPGLRQLPDFK